MLEGATSLSGVEAEDGHNEHNSPEHSSLHTCFEGHNVMAYPGDADQRLRYYIVFVSLSPLSPLRLLVQITPTGLITILGTEK